MLNSALIAAPAPRNENTNVNQGFVLNNVSRYFPSRTPTKTVPTMVTPIWEK